MDKTSKTKALLELRSYRVNKRLVESIQEYLELHNRMLQAIQSVQAIDAALAELPEEVSQYAREKYFNGERYTPDGLSIHFHVVNKTISRWDKMLLTAVCRYLEAAKL